MKLSFNDIKKMIFGAVRFVEQDGYLVPRRCTEMQEEIHGKYIPDSGKYSKMSAGVRLDFHTNSSTIRLALRPEATSYDVLINGAFVRAVLGGDGVFEADLPSGESRVTVVFPIGAYGAVKEIELDNGASVRAHEYKRKFLFFGDSITQGFSAERSYLTYAYRVADFFDADFLDQAVGCGDMMATAFDGTIEYNPDAVFIAFGTNDYNHFPTLQRLRERGSEYLDLVKEKYAGKKFFGLLPLWRGDTDKPRSMGSFDACRAVIRELHEERGFEVIDCYGFVPQSPEYYADGFLHPNDLCFSIYAQNLIKAVNDKL